MGKRSIEFLGDWLAGGRRLGESWVAKVEEKEGKNVLRIPVETAWQAGNNLLQTRRSFPRHLQRLYRAVSPCRRLTSAAPRSTLQHIQEPLPRHLCVTRTDSRPTDVQRGPDVSDHVSRCASIHLVQNSLTRTHPGALAGFRAQSAAFPVVTVRLFSRSMAPSAKCSPLSTIQ